MKTKLFFVIAFTLFVQIANAQRIGIKAGVNFANMNFSSSGVSMSPKSITAFHAGLVADFKCVNNLYFNTGLLYSLKGTKMDLGGINGTDKIHYLEIPLNMAYKFSITETSDFFIQAGPYLAYGLSGKDKSDGITTDLFSEKLVKRFDWGLGFGGGVELGSIVASLNYQLGLADLNDDSTTNATIKSKVFQISLAYMFGSKR
ncbi:MAG TPA: porin family protein [Prolixibacteraceae bacterium]|jgi:hypothetical protein